jgi:uncharacterized membrane protein YfcA
MGIGASNSKAIVVKARLGFEHKPFTIDMIISVLSIAIGLLVIVFSFDDPLDLITQRWPVFLTAIVAAGVANATAVGGGFIFMPLFSFGYGFSSLESLKLALATQAFGMTSGALAWSTKRIVFRILSFSLLFSIVGMILGSFYITPDQSHINIAFGAASLGLAIILVIEVYYSKKTSRKSEIQTPTTTDLFVFSFICLLGGMITAWVSIGIGEVVALWMLLRWNYPLSLCISTGVAALAGCSIAGLLIHSELGGIRWDFLAFTAPGVVIGGRLGARLGVFICGDTREETQIDNYNSGDKLKHFIIAVIFVDGVAVLFNTL